jgi:glycosyltransferase involved in cell wall biosynthesis
MAKIAVIVSNPCTGDARVIKMAEAAAESGHEVHVFATQGKNISAYEYRNDVYYHRIEWKLPVILASNIFFKLLRKINKDLYGFVVKRIAPFIKYYLFRKTFSNTIIDIHPDIVHAHDLICLPTGEYVAKECGAKLVFDAHELEVHRHPPLPFFQKKFVANTEKKYASKADAVITVGDHIAKILERDLKRNDLNVLFNSPVIKKSYRNIRSDLKLSESTRLIIYVGKVTIGRGVEDILATLPSLKSVHFATIGPCDSRIKIKVNSIAQKLGVSDKFSILPPVYYTDVVEYIKGADMGVIASDLSALSYRLAMPNKLFEMSFANIPILASDFVEIGGYLVKYGNGETVDFERKETNIYNISKFLENKNDYILTDENYKKIDEKYSWDVQKQKLAAIYFKLLNENI